jgi:succinoglycan biosynthesis protein ExoA
MSTDTVPRHEPTPVGPDPLVSVVVPVLNEAVCLDEVLDRLSAQTFEGFEAVFADGGSTDGTRERLRAAAAGDPRVRFVDNPRGLQSAGLNEALRVVRGRYVVRLDGHSFIDVDYLARVVEVLEATGADVVGGRMVPRPVPTRRGRAIALANRSAWGAGPARFHTGGAAGPVETVYLGSFRREALERVDGWAEDVGVNEDYELNHRVRATGGVVWFDPSLSVGYEPRSTLRSLVRQYRRYGRSKATVARRHPRSVRFRQGLPALGVPALVAGALVAWWVPVALVAGHVALLGALAVPAARRAQEPPSVGSLSVVAATAMHWSWSAGFWAGLVRPFPRAGEHR